MSPKRKFWIGFVIGLNMVPLLTLANPQPAPSREPNGSARLQANPPARVAPDPLPSPSPAPAPAPAAYVEADLTYDEAHALFPTFDVSYAGSPSYQAMLTGKVFKDCADLFTIVSTASEASLTTRSRNQGELPNVGFSIRDEGGRGRACQRGITGGCSTAEGHNQCVSLSDRPGGKANFAGVGRAHLGFLNRNPNDDITGFTFSAAGHDYLHNGAAYDGELRRAAAHDARVRNVINAYNSFCQNIRVNPVVAEAQLNALLMLPHDRLDEANLSLDESRLRLALVESELQGIEARIRSASVDDLALIREELQAFLASHPELSRRVAASYGKVASRYVAIRGAGLDNFDLALETLREVSEFDDLDDTTAARVARSTREFEVGRMMLISRGGMQGNMLFGSNYYQLMSHLQSDMASSCNAGGGGFGMSGGFGGMSMFGGGIASMGSFSSGGSRSGFSMEACNSARQAMQVAMSLPRQAQMVDQQNYQQQMNFNQMMMQAMNPAGMQQGYGGMGGMTGGMGPMGGGMNFGGGNAFAGAGAMPMSTMPGQVPNFGMGANGGGTFGAQGNFMGSSPMSWAL